MPKLTSKRSEVEPFHAMDVLAEANRLRAEGLDVISMAVGQPSAPVPTLVREAAAAALARGHIGYTDALGTAQLRAAISRHYGDHYGLDVPAGRIIVTTGSSAGFNLAFLAMFDVGDRVAITTPGYPAYRNILAALGLEAVEIDLGDDAYLTGDRLALAHAEKSIDGVLFASPANPTGASIPPDALAQLIRTARELGIAVISDEIYHRLSYEAADTSALAVSDDLVVINSFSKYYCMTGWRVGWMVVPDGMVRAIERLQQNLYISAPELSQIAAAAAFDATDELEIVKDSYRQSRAVLLDRLPKIGLPLAAPMDGAFYAYCDVSRLTNDSMAFARAMIAEAHVAATPGHDFDVANGNRFMRFSYAGKPADMVTALDRVEDWLRRR